MRPVTLTRTDEAPDDEALIARWQGGDERAATALVERHAQPVARFVASLGVRDDVEEIVEQAREAAADTAPQRESVWTKSSRPFQCMRCRRRVIFSTEP